MSAPPSPPEIHSSVTWASPAVALKTAAGGSVAGVALALALSAPSPTELYARTWKRCTVPLRRPVTVKLAAFSSPGPLSVISDQASVSSVPSVVERKSQCSIAAPPSPPDVHASVTWALPAVAVNKVAAGGTAAAVVGVIGLPNVPVPVLDPISYVVAGLRPLMV